MNYIKGARYQMYCEAREVGVRTCTVRPFSLSTLLLVLLLTPDGPPAALRRDAARSVQGAQRRSNRPDRLRSRNVRAVFSTLCPT